MKKIITLSLVAATLLFTACGEKTEDATAKAVESTKEAAHNIADASKEAANKAIESAKKATAEAKVAADKALEDTKEAATKAVEKTEAAIGSVLNTEGKAAYAKCSGCHGVDGKTKALGKSAEIAGLDKAVLIEMLNAYKAGTRNEAGMGMLMKGQVASMDDATIDAVASYISTLK